MIFGIVYMACLCHCRLFKVLIHVRKFTKFNWSTNITRSNFHPRQIYVHFSTVPMAKCESIKCRHIAVSFCFHRKYAFPWSWIYDGWQNTSYIIYISGYIISSDGATIKYDEFVESLSHFLMGLSDAFFSFSSFFFFLFKLIWKMMMIKMESSRSCSLWPLNTVDISIHRGRSNWVLKVVWI